MEAIDKLRELSKKLEDPYFIKEFEEGFEKFLKERDMKIYHVETQQDYDALMSELEEKGFKWRNGEKPTQLDKFKYHGKDTYVYEEYGEITISGVECFKKYHSDKTFIEYKARGDKQMLNTECKQCHKKWHHDNAKYCTMCGKKLVDEPEFKSGDIVASRAFSDGSFSLSGDYFKKYHSDVPVIEYKARGEKMEKNENVKYLMFDTTDDVGLISVKVISENLDEFKTHVLKYLLDKESDTGYIELGLLNPDNSVERLEL